MYLCTAFHEYWVEEWQRVDCPVTNNHMNTHVNRYQTSDFRADFVFQIAKVNATATVTQLKWDNNMRVSVCTYRQSFLHCLEDINTTNKITPFPKLLTNQLLFSAEEQINKSSTCLERRLRKLRMTASFNQVSAQNDRFVLNYFCIFPCTLI